MIRKVIIFSLFIPAFLFAGMVQSDLKDTYSSPVILDGNKKTINIDLPVDSIDGYRWFLNTTDYDYIRAVSFDHESVDVENSKWGGVDKFKLQVTDRFKKAPHKMILHFECFQPWNETGNKITKDVTILSLVN